MSTGTGPTSALAREVRMLLGDAVAQLAHHPDALRLLTKAANRFDEPLRVSIAGRVKAGKSTLLNALVGEQLAPTDASECTRTVTWYRDGVTYRVTLLAVDGRAVTARFTRDAGAIDVDLGGLDIADVRRIDVEWPSAALRELTLIDTPGIASLSQEVAERTLQFLAPEDDVPDADAVVYLVRHVHPDDVRLLESFHGDGIAEDSPVSAIAVLARADEIGGGRLDALTAAASVAERNRADPAMRRLAQTVVPIAGLLAQGGSTLREADVAVLAELALLDRDAIDALLLSADRLVADDPSIAVPPLVRRELLDRLGLFGVRLSIALLRQGEVRTAAALSSELVRRSGLPDLWHLLRSQFAARAEVLKARSALRALEVALHLPGVDSPALAGEVERLLASGHELAELRLLDACRREEVGFSLDVRDEAEVLLGIAGPTPAARLGLAPTATIDELRQAALVALARWQDRAESPLSPRPVAEAARVLVRSCEGIVVALATA